MSANTPEDREAEKKEALDAMTEMIAEYTGWSQAPARNLAELIYNAEPLRCDFDCDHCRE